MVEFSISTKSLLQQHHIRRHSHELDERVPMANNNNNTTTETIFSHFTKRKYVHTHSAYVCGALLEYFEITQLVFRTRTSETETNEGRWPHASEIYILSSLTGARLDHRHTPTDHFFPIRSPRPPASQWIEENKNRKKERKKTTATYSLCPLSGRG